MSYIPTDPIGHSMPETSTAKGHRPAQSLDVASNIGRMPSTRENNWEKRSLSNLSNKAAPKQEDETIAYAEQMLKNEANFQKQQKQYLNSEYQKQAKEREMQRVLERERKVQEHAVMKAQEQQQQSIQNILKRNELANQKSLMSDYKSAIEHKQQLMGVEKEIELRLAKNMEATARQSLYQEGSQRKEMLEKFKDDFKNDYEQRMKQRTNQKYSKAQEQAEYRKLFEENTQREIANERAYKKRFEDFENKVNKKQSKYYEICHDGDFKRDNAIKKMNGDSANYYDYYDNREKNKLRKAEDLKDNCYKSMKSTIDQKHRNQEELKNKRFAEAQRSVEELKKYHDDIRAQKGDRTFKDEYRGILETQVKMKNKPQKFKINDFDNTTSELGSTARAKGEMYMIPGINSVSPYVKTQRKGQVALGDHYSKMKNIMDTNKAALPVNTSLTAHPSINKLNNPMSTITSTPKAIAAYDTNPSASARDLGVSAQDKSRPNVLAHQAENSIINLGHPSHYNHNPGIMGNKSMTEYLYRKQNNLGGQQPLQRSLNL